VNSGFCCDQVTLYDPSHNAIFWLQQYIEDTTTGTQRINVDMGADGSFDCAYDFTPQDLGEPPGRSYDFPDLVLGANYLYHTSNIGSIGSPFVTEAMISRYPLDSIAACTIPLNYGFLLLTDYLSLRPTHGAGTTMYWGTHISTSSLRIYRWDEGSGTIYWDDRSITTWADGGGTCAGPDGRDWCGRADGRILAAYVADGVIGFLWNSAQHGAFPYPYVRMARFDESTRNLIDQPVVWSPSIAWQYPSVAVNGRGDLGGTILAGGGAFYPQCQAWIADDINSGVFQPLENAQVVASDSGPDENKSGDYLTSRPHSPLSNTWVATCFSLQGGGADSHARPRYVWFGRERDAPDPYEPNNSPDEPTAIGCGFSSEAPRIGPLGGDVDFYRIAAPTGTLLTVDVDAWELGSTLDSVLGVFDGEGALLAYSDDDWAADELSTPDSYLEFEVPASGVYFIAVSAYNDDDFNGDGGSAGFYTLSVGCDLPVEPFEPNDALEQAWEIACDFSSDQARIEPGGADVDLFRIGLPAGAVVTVDIDAAELGSSLDPVLGILTSEGEVQAVSDDTPAPGEPPGLDPYLEFVAPVSGNYIVAVSAYDDFDFGGDGMTEGFYTISVACEIPPDPLEPNNSLGSATPIDCGFASDAPHIAPLGDVDFYALVVPPLTRLAVDITADELGSSLDSLLGLFDGDGGLVAISDDDPAPGEPSSYDSYLEHTALEGGTFYVGVTSFADYEFNGDGVLTAGYYVFSVACEAICPGPDGDGDGVPDGCDNCTEVVNASQTDTDADGYGNACDGDFNNNGVVDFADYGRFRAMFGHPPGPAAP
jgi:hypothetical protein